MSISCSLARNAPLRSFVGLLWVLCGPLRSFVVLCGPLRSFAVFSHTRIGTSNAKNRGPLLRFLTMEMNERGYKIKDPH